MNTNQENEDIERRFINNRAAIVGRAGDFPVSSIYLRSSEFICG
jgi:hypothetical protein